MPWCRRGLNYGGSKPPPYDIPHYNTNRQGRQPLCRNLCVSVGAIHASPLQNTNILMRRSLKHLLFFLYRHAQSRESKKAVLNDSCRNAVCPQNYKTEQKSSYWVQGRPARHDPSALRAATDSRPGHQKEKQRRCLHLFADVTFHPRGQSSVGWDRRY